MSITSTPFPRPQGYCVTKQCCCEYANSFGYCSYTTACMKSTTKKTEYITSKGKRGRVMAKDKIDVTLPESVVDRYANFESTHPTVTGAVDCIICDTPIPIYDHWVTSPVVICSECRKRLKHLLYKDKEE